MTDVGDSPVVAGAPAARGITAGIADEPRDGDASDDDDDDCVVVSVRRTAPRRPRAVLMDSDDSGDEQAAAPADPYALSTTPGKRVPSASGCMLYKLRIRRSITNHTSLDCISTQRPAWYAMGY